jgi:hypothetical protein
LGLGIVTNTIRFDAVKGTLKSDVAMIPNRLLDGAEEAILEVAHLMAGLAQVHVRVDTGSLRDSIRVERGGKTLHWRQVRVRAGGYVVNPKTGRLVDYAGAVEAKYPYMKPAWASVRPQAETIIRRCCLAAVDRIPSVAMAR